MSDVYGGFDPLERGEAERLRRDLDDARKEIEKARDALGEALLPEHSRQWEGESPVDALIRWRDELHVELGEWRKDGRRDARALTELRAALATVTLDRDVWRAQCEQARGDADYHRSRAESWQATAQTHMEQRDEARAEVERLTRDRAEDDAEVVTYKGEVLRLRCALLAAERERDVLREEVTHLRLEVELAERRGAEAMREAAAQACLRVAHSESHYAPNVGDECAEAVRALPLPGDEP